MIAPSTGSCLRAYFLYINLFWESIIRTQLSGSRHDSRAITSTQRSAGGANHERLYRSRQRKAPLITRPPDLSEAVKGDPCRQPMSSTSFKTTTSDQSARPRAWISRTVWWLWDKIFLFHTGQVYLSRLKRYAEDAHQMEKWRKDQQREWDRLSTTVIHFALDSGIHCT